MTYIIQKTAKGTAALYSRSLTHIADLDTFEAVDGLLTLEFSKRFREENKGLIEQLEELRTELEQSHG